jgi:uncharacterized membrane protein YdbT with pleckstrin-like domain
MNHDNPLIYRAKLHWIIFLGPVLLMLFSLYLVVGTELLREVGYFLFAAGVIWALITWTTYHFSSVTIQQKQIILYTGFLVRQSVTIQLNKIESIDVRQTLIGSILRYGSLVINGTGGRRHMIQLLSNPLACRRHIEQLMPGG